MEMLNNPANNEAITWLPHGKAFSIYKKKSFAEVVLPAYFKACKYTSFTRKVSYHASVETFVLEILACLFFDAHTHPFVNLSYGHSWPNLTPVACS